jgi:hypothetical protein
MGTPQGKTISSPHYQPARQEKVAGGGYQKTRAREGKNEAES